MLLVGFLRLLILAGLHHLCVRRYQLNIHQSEYSLQTNTIIEEL